MHLSRKDMIHLDSFTWTLDKPTAYLFAWIHPSGCLDDNLVKILLQIPNWLPGMGLLS